MADGPPFDCPDCYGRPRGLCPNCGQIGPEDNEPPFISDRCPTCAGGGLVWLSSGSKRRGRVNEDWSPCMVAFRCPDCPDDGSGDSVGTGRRA